MAPCFSLGLGIQLKSDSSKTRLSVSVRCSQVPSAAAFPDSHQLVRARGRDRRRSAFREQDARQFAHKAAERRLAGRRSQWGCELDGNRVPCPSGKAAYGPDHSIFLRRAAVSDNARPEDGGAAACGLAPTSAYPSILGLVQCWRQKDL